MQKYTPTHFNGDGRGGGKFPATTEELKMISPNYYMNEIQALVSVHYGSADTRVPAAWASFVCGEFKNGYRNGNFFWMGAGLAHHPDSGWRDYPAERHIEKKRIIVIPMKKAR